MLHHDERTLKEFEASRSHCGDRGGTTGSISKSCISSFITSFGRLSRKSFSYRSVSRHRQISSQVCRRRT